MKHLGTSSSGALVATLALTGPGRSSEGNPEIVMAVGDHQWLSSGGPSHASPRPSREEAGNDTPSLLPAPISCWHLPLAVPIRSQRQRLMLTLQVSLWVTKQCGGRMESDLGTNREDLVQSWKGWPSMHFILSSMRGHCGV